MTFKKKQALFLLMICSAQPLVTHAVDWHDTSVGIRWGDNFREPETGDKVTKTIFNLTHVSGDKWGTNLFVVDLFLSNRSDPSRNGNGAREIYGFYKRSFSLATLADINFSNTFVKDVSLNARIDLGRKNFALSPRPKKLRLGVSADLAVPIGRMDIGIDAYHERSHNGIVGKDVNFDTTYAIWSTWSFPIYGKSSFEGLIDHIGPMGKDGFGVKTKPSTMVRLNYIYDIGAPGGFKVGVGYQYWRNKYGNDNKRDSKRGSTENAYTLQLNYHF